jgi:hypothetical protein
LYLIIEEPVRVVNTSGNIREAVGGTMGGFVLRGFAP